MQRIVPHLWYDKEAREAAEFYVSIFPDSKVTNVTTLHDTPSGDTDIVSFDLWGQPFMAISAGPMFKFNESISFMVYCETQEEIDRYWDKLSADPEAVKKTWTDLSSRPRTLPSSHSTNLGAATASRASETARSFGFRTGWSPWPRTAAVTGTSGSSTLPFQGAARPARS